MTHKDQELRDLWHIYKHDWTPSGLTFLDWSPVLVVAGVVWAALG